MVEIIRDFLTVMGDLPPNIEQVHILHQIHDSLIWFNGNFSITCEKMTKYMTCFALFVDVFYKISSYKIYLPQLIEKLRSMV